MNKKQLKILNKYLADAETELKVRKIEAKEVYDKLAYLQALVLSFKKKSPKCFKNDKKQA